VRPRRPNRLAFGQPRQDDLLAVLDQADLDADTASDLKIDLRPPSSS
jgi:hypothetical protein